jgi:hypothetical protein
MQTCYFITLAVLFIIVIWISLKSDMLRNSVFDCTAIDTRSGQTGKPVRPAFSLARTQLAFWSVIVIGSYIYVAFFTHGAQGVKFAVELSGVNLILLGISAGTTVVGKAIDSNQQTNASPTGTAAVPTPSAKVQQNQPASGFFFVDIISDETGVSIHRLQNVIWTIVVGVIYISFVNVNCALPDQKVITDMLLGLMGISSAAYLGVKTKENTATTTTK